MTATLSDVDIERLIAEHVERQVAARDPQIAKAIAEGIRVHADIQPNEKGAPSVQFGRIDSMVSGSSVAQVVLDGDTTDTPIGVLTDLDVGQRAAVLFYPGGGALALGQVSPGSPGTLIGALKGSVANATTAPTSLDDPAGAAWWMRSTSGAVAAGDPIGRIAMGAQYDTANFNDDLVALLATAEEVHSVSAAGTGATIYTTPLGAVGAVGAQRWSAAGNSHFLGGIVDAEAVLQGGAIRQTSHVQIMQPGLVYNGNTRANVTTTNPLTGAPLITTGCYPADGSCVVATDPYVINSAGHNFRSTDVGKTVFSGRNTGATSAGALMFGHITDVDPAAGPSGGGAWARLNFASFDDFSGEDVVIGDPGIGSPHNLVTDLTLSAATWDHATGTWTQQNYAPWIASPSNIGPNGFVGFGGQTTVEVDSELPLGLQSFFTMRNARGTNVHVIGGFGSWWDCDNMTADGGTITFDSLGPGLNGFMANLTFQTVRDGYIDLTGSEFTEFQTASGIQGNVDMQGHVGYAALHVAMRRTTSGSIARVTAASTAITTTSGFFTAAMDGHVIVGRGIPRNTTLVSHSSSTAGILSQAATQTFGAGSEIVVAVNIGSVGYDYNHFINQQNFQTTTNQVAGIGSLGAIEFAPYSAALLAHGHAFSDVRDGHALWSDPFPDGYIFNRAAYTYDLVGLDQTYVTWGQTSTLLQSGSVAASAPAHVTFENTGIWQNDTSKTALDLGDHRPVNIRPTYIGDTHATTMTAYRGLVSSPTFAGANSGTLTVTDAIGLQPGMTINTGANVGLRRGMYVRDVTGTGTLDSQVGIDIELLDFATGINIGFRNASAFKQLGNATFKATTTFLGPVVGISSFDGSVPIALLPADATYGTNPAAGGMLYWANSYTFNTTLAPGPRLGPIAEDAATIIIASAYYGAGGTGGTTQMHRSFLANPTYTNTPSSAFDMGTASAYYDSSTWTANGAALALGTNSQSLRSNPTFSAVGTGGEIKAGSTFAAIRSGLSIIGKAVLTERIGLYVEDATVTGTGPYTRNVTALTGATTISGPWTRQIDDCATIASETALRNLEDSLAPADGPVGVAAHGAAISGGSGITAGTTIEAVVSGAIATTSAPCTGSNPSGISFILTQSTQPTIAGANLYTAGGTAYTLTSGSSGAFDQTQDVGSAVTKVSGTGTVPSGTTVQLVYDLTVIDAVYSTVSTTVTSATNLFRPSHVGALVKVTTGGHTADFTSSPPTVIQSVDPLGGYAVLNQVPAITSAAGRILGIGDSTGKTAYLNQPIGGGSLVVTFTQTANPGSSPHTWAATSGASIVTNTGVRINALTSGTNNYGIWNDSPLMQNAYAAIPSITLQRVDGTATSPTHVLSGEALGQLNFAGQIDTTVGNTFASAFMFANATEDWTSIARGTRLRFIVTANGSTSTTTAVRIEQDATLAALAAFTVAGASTLTGLLTANGGLTIAGTAFPAFGVATTTFLRNDGTWVAPSGTGLSTTLTAAHIYVGNGSAVATDVAVSGVIAMSNAGVTSFGTAGTLPSATVATTQSFGDNSTKLATTAYSAFYLDLTAPPSNVVNVSTATSFGSRAYAAANVFRIERVDGSAGSPSVIQSADVLGQMQFGGASAVSGTTATIVAGAGLRATATQTWTGSVAGTKLELRTVPNGSLVLATALTLDQDQSATFAGAVTLGSTLTGGAASDIAINTTKFTVAASSGNTSIGGTLAVTGAVTLTVPLAIAQGGTNKTSWVAGDLAYASATNVLGGLAISGSTGLYLKGGTAPAWVQIVDTDISGWQTAYVQSADATTASTTLVDITGLTIAIATAGSYEFEATLNMVTDSTSTGTGIQFGVAYSGTTSAIRSLFVGPTVGTVGSAGAVTTSAVPTSNGTAVASATFLAGVNVKGTVKVWGTIILTVAGTLSIQHLKITGGTTPTSTAKIGSVLRVKKLNT